jgi:rhamnosyltransferase subunit B
LAILSAPGSRGDVNPMIGIGRELVGRGAEVVISLAEPYAESAADAGLIPEVVIDAARFESLLGDRRFWKPVRGAARLLRSIVREFLATHDAVIRRHVRAGETVLVAHPLDLASPIYRDAHPDVPLVDVHLSPALLQNPSQPTTLSPWGIEQKLPAPAVALGYRLLNHLFVRPLIGRAVNRHRGRYGLPATRHPVGRWGRPHFPTLAMYPQWYAPESSEFSPPLVHVGFPVEDAAGGMISPPDDEPIVFTGGTAFRHAREFFRRAADACQTLGRAGVLLTGYPQNLPDTLPRGVRGSGYVPLGELLPHCAAIVHHGGIGTTARGLAAGIPQVVRPMAYDQFDNANRVERLGCGRRLDDERHLTECLGEVLASEHVSASARNIAVRLDDRDACARAAKFILDKASATS